ncbi:P-loop containing nucleoside triphosphate hydrolase protein, partial [Piptocephalis cylindrospora]
KSDIGGKGNAPETAAAPITKPKTLFPNWTGKVPATLLSEFCQKNKWNRPEYFSRQIKAGFVTAVSLSRKDLKNSSKLERVHFEPPDLIVQPTAALAKHAGATYALHRVACNLSLQRALPPEHRELWRSFEEIRLQEADAGTWKYKADPFAEKATRERERAEREAGRARRVEEASRKDASGPTDWVKSLPEVKMSQEMRDEAERVIKQATQEMSLRPSRLPKEGGMKVNSSAIIKSLAQQGFRDQHVEEALKYTSTEDRALNWLCVHVPEDDLPRQFWRKEYRSTLTATKHTPESLAREKAVGRLSHLGFSRKACDEALQATGDHEGNALLQLCTRLLPPSGPSADSTPSATLEEISQSQEIQDLREEEKATLEAIYGDETFTTWPGGWSVAVDVTGLEGAVELQMHLPPHSTYPYSLPAIILVHPAIPTYIRLATIRRLSLHAQDQLALGEPKTFDLVCWVQEHLPSLIRDPPPLLETPADATATTGEEGSSSDGKGKGDRGNRERSSRGSGNNQGPVVRLEDLKRRAREKAQDPGWIKMQHIREKLPSFKSAEEVVRIVNSHSVSIICGETGCGKTTQVPQFLLDAAILATKGNLTNIICTQPRRLSAIGVAERVAAERVERVGDQVGYAVRGQNRQSRGTQILFCTTGILLRRLQSDPMLQGVTHIIIDEVHERSVDSDLLLILLKRLLKRRPENLHLVLMSATANAQAFAAYFPFHVPVINIPGLTHPVQQIYLEDFIRDINLSNLDRPSRYSSSSSSSSKTKEVKAQAERYRHQGFSDPAIACMSSVDEGGIDYGLIAEVVRHIDREDPNPSGAVLIFMPGVPEIRRCIDALASTGAYVMPLHANLSTQEQSRVFSPAPPKAGRKVIVATNVAETSITIDGIVYVVDTGKVKETQIDERCEMMRLVETWTSRASTRQRQGRAGRTRPGVCYKVYTRHTEGRRMPQATPPEILRMPLAQVCLQIKGLGVTDVSSFLQEALDTPNVSAVEAAMMMLEEAGVLDEATHLTSLGKHMTFLPVDFRLGKMLIYGALFRCVSPILTIVARLSGKSPFISPMEKREEAKAARKAFETGQSDLLTDLMAFTQWNECSRRDRRRFCEENFLSYHVLQEMETTRRQLRDALLSLSFIQDPSNVKEADANADNVHLLRAIIVAGLYPHILKVRVPKQKYDRVMSGTVEREKVAKEHRMFPIRRKTSPAPPGRVFLHPSSMLFACTRYDPPFVAYFSQMALSDKTFVHDGTIASLYALLLFGGSGGGCIRVDHTRQTLSIGEDIHLYAWARIGVLMNEIRLLLDQLLGLKMSDP